jgi:hypothetical protein
MFMPEHILLPLWADALAAKIGVSVGFFEVFQAANFTAHFMLLIVLFAPLAVLLPNPAMKPKKTSPSLPLAFAVAGMIWLTLGLLGQPRTFLYFQF